MARGDRLSLAVILVVVSAHRIQALVVAAVAALAGGVQVFAGLRVQADLVFVVFLALTMICSGVVAGWSFVSQSPIEKLSERRLKVVVGRLHAADRVSKNLAF